MDDVWKAPDGENSTTPSPPTQDSEGPGEATAPLSALIDDIKANVGGYFTAGLAYLIAVMGLIAIALGGIVIGILPGAILENEPVMMAGGALGFLVYIVTILGFSFIVVPLMMAAMMRAAAAHLDGGETIGFSSSFRGLTQNASSIISFYLVQQVLVMMGALFFYIPGLIAMVVCQLAFAMVVLEDASIGDALSRSWEHVKNNAGWHAIVWILLFLFLIVAELTIIGLVFFWPAMAVYGVLVHRAAKA